MTRSQYTYLMLPAATLLTIIFFSPLLWFMLSTLARLSQHGGAGVASYIGKVLTAPAVTTAMLGTVRISAIVTLAALAVSYPIAYYLTRAGKLAFNLVILCVIVPYFTSVIVRTYAWMVLLGRTGVVNDLLRWIGAAGQPFKLLYSETGVLIGMTYVLMPYTVLTLYAAMKTIDPRLMQAAEGMGAGRLYSFWRIYLPLSLGGVVSGGLIVFILALGYFITPALMGGPRNVMIAMLIQQQVEVTLNWPLAAILSLALLAVTLVMFWIYVRLGGLKALIGEQPQ